MSWEMELAGHDADGRDTRFEMVGVTELTRLRAVAARLKYALSQKGDDVCWRDLYNDEVADLVGVELDPRPLTEEQFVDRNCRHFYRCLAAGTPYETPTPEDHAA